MKITISPTEHFFMAGDMMVRMWQGVAEDGIECVALVTAVGFSWQAAGLAEKLVEIPPPTVDDQRRWARSILGQGDDDG